MLANVIGRQFRSAFNWPLGAALAVLMILIVIGCLIIMQRYADVMEVNTNANK
jgi:spermidine/putrescine transport system permease protein